jgi:hypothetical protein
VRGARQRDGAINCTKKDALISQRINLRFCAQHIL